MDNVKVFISVDGTESNGYEFTSNNFKKVKFASQAFDTTYDINPCVVEQYAEIVFKDKNNFIRNLVKEGQLSKDMWVFVYVNNVLLNTYLTSSWDIQAQDTTITLHCNDPVKKLENTLVEPLGIAMRTFSSLLSYAFSFTQYRCTYDDLGFVGGNLIVYNSYIELQTVLEFLNKLCILGFIRIYWHINTFKVMRCI